MNTRRKICRSVVMTAKDYKAAANVAKINIKTNYKGLTDAIKTDRKSIGLYSKLSVTFAVLSEKAQKKVFKFLTNSKHTHTTCGLRTGFLNAKIYSVSLDSIEKAYAFKLKIKKIIKEEEDGIQTRKPSNKPTSRKNTRRV